jgi:hypothetical protein
MTNLVQLHPREADRQPATTRSELEHWAGEINERLCRAVGAIVEAGRLLLEAKTRLKHGEWERLFHGNPQAVAKPIPISVNTAQRLMAIARHPILSNPAHSPRLPRSWTTLYELTKVDAATLRASLGDGRIHPGLDRRQAAALRAGNGGPHHHVPAALRALRRRLDAVALVCPVSHRADLVRMLREYADALERKAPHRDEEREAG